jgi:Right handed beta helix region
MLPNLQTRCHVGIHVRTSRSLIKFTLLAACALPGFAATLCVNPGGTGGCKSTISAAVSAAYPGDIIQVAAGTYKETVSITKSLSLVAVAPAQPVIDATGLSNGIFVNGMEKAPNPGVGNILIEGFKIANANFEGVLIANASDVVLVNNLVTDNNKALDVSGAACPGIPAFETSEAMDCGEGIHLMAANHASIVNNESTGNSGGVLITDETGASHDNLVTGNNVHDNPYACGITMASHPAATSVIPTAMVSFGVMTNTISHNMSFHNGTGAPGAGAGVGIFAAGPGNTSTGNVVTENELYDNGLPGVTMHNHAPVTGSEPAVNLNNNVILLNHIYGNAADTEDAATPGPTGINIHSLVPIYGTVISQNTIEDEAVDVAFKAPVVSQLLVHFNNVESTGIGVDNLGAGTVVATDNWWNCAGGPGASGCTTVSGTNVIWSPWLTSAF